jgi:hypothetical protein
MSLTNEFINNLSRLRESDRSLLRALAGQPLDAKLQGFDLFSGLWWPLRKKNSSAPRREPSWLIAKLFCLFQIPNVRPESDDDSSFSLPHVLGRLEPFEERDRGRFRTRFDAILCSSLSSLEPLLQWALKEVAFGVSGSLLGERRIDWARLLDDLSIWNRRKDNRRKHDIRGIWAEIYLNAIMIRRA